MSIEKDNITVVLPTLNEEQAIETVVKELMQMGYCKILVVDGYSTDETVSIAASNGCQVVLQHGKGKSGAIETAIETVETPYMLVMDGDCTYDPKDVNNLITHAEKYDQIIGVRFNGRSNIPLINRLGNWLITNTFNILMGTKLSDVCSGMYLINTEAARQLDVNTKGFDVEVELAAQNASRGKVTEVPITYRKRVGSQKLRSWRHGFQILRALFSLARNYNPALLFSGLVALAIIPAMFLLGWVAFEVLTTGIWHSGFALTGIMLLLLAAQGLTVATIAILVRNTEKRILRQTRLQASHLFDLWKNRTIAQTNENTMDKKDKKDKN